ncbi:MAG TPA: hypothetical protein VL137_13345 [Polyangiaceae bacterium]|nr:hypothetical protein [Polyangiaceae bacterium]
MPKMRAGAPKVMPKLWLSLVMLVACGCGGSASETPPPLEPAPEEMTRASDHRAAGAEGHADDTDTPDESEPAAEPAPPAL